MESQFFKSEFKRLSKLNPDIFAPSDSQIDKLFDLTQIMLEVNEHINLTNITDCSQIILKHYIDSLSVANQIRANSSIIDIGCGAGFPSLPLAICRPDIKILALDSTAKRINYVNSTAAKLGLKNIEAVAARAEDFINSQKLRESFDYAIARAVADLPILCELCIPYVKVGGYFISMKAAKGDEEYARSKNAIKSFGGLGKEVISCDISSDGENFESRRLIVIEKVSKTSKIYPRKYSQILKKPL